MTAHTELREFLGTKAKIDQVYLQNLAHKISEAMKSHAWHVLSPAIEKQEPTYLAVRVEQMTGISRATLNRRATDNPDYPSGRIEGSRRLYTLSEVHKIMDLEGIRPSKGKAPTMKLGVLNFKGGVNKTTTTINIGQDLAEKGYRVLLVDMDPQASLTTLFGLFPDRDVESEQTISALLCGDESDLGYAVRRTNWDGLDLIPSNLWVAVGETILPARQSSTDDFLFFDVVRKGLQPIEDNYDVILFDTPPSLGFITHNALWAADALLIPCPASMLDVQSSALFVLQTASVIESLNEHARENKVFQFMKFLITKFVSKTDGSKADESDDKKRSTSEAMAAWIRGSYGSDCVMNATMPQTEAVPSGAAIYKTLYELRPGDINRDTLSRAMIACRAVCDEVEMLIKSCWGA